MIKLFTPTSIIILSFFHLVFYGGLVWGIGSWTLLFLLAQLIGAALGYQIFTELNHQHLQQEPPKSAGETTLQIANETMPYLRQGLNEETAQKIAELIFKISQVDAVAVTDREKILGFTGVGCKHHLAGRSIITNVTKDAIEDGIIKIIEQTKDFNCQINNCSCPLKSAVVAPLKCEGVVMGTIKLYRTYDSSIPEHTSRLAMGIAQLLSMQLELAEKDRQSQLVTKARLEALQAQIHPHFLFNVLNTIIAFSRTDQAKTRHLLVNLARFFRKAFNQEKGIITFKEEIDYLETYLTLEKARYGDKLKVNQKIDPRIMEYTIPVLCIQPLVENLE